MQYFLAILPPPEFRNLICETFKGLIEQPHITVKAQCGLTPKVGEWLPNTIDAVKGFGSFEINIAEPSYFGDSVLFLSVYSKEIYALHGLLMQTISPPLEQASEFFELEGWRPHLTLSIGKKSLSSENLEKANALPTPLTFHSIEISLFCQKNIGEPYQIIQNLPLE